MKIKTLLPLIKKRNEQDLGIGEKKERKVERDGEI